MASKEVHEIRDPLYGFIRVSAQEREILDLPAVQRLRHIHQLALTMLVYPGATHRRFEHSLGGTPSGVPEVYRQRGFLSSSGAGRRPYRWRTRCSQKDCATAAF